MSAYDDAFQSLLYGDGSLIGLTLILGVSILLLLRWKYSAVLLLPVHILLTVQYLTNNLDTHAFVLGFLAFFNLAYLAVKRKEN